MYRTCSAVVLATLITVPVAGQGPLETPAPAAAVQPEIRDGRDYRVYDRSGNPSSLEAVVAASLSDEVLLVGEEHDDMIGHAFQTRLLEVVLDRIAAPSAAGRDVVLSLEMFERDVQYIVDEYLSGEISEDHFLRSSRPWPDYEGRYRPAVEVARERGVPLVAANAPRRYVSRVTSLARDEPECHLFTGVVGRRDGTRGDRGARSTHRGLRHSLRGVISRRGVDRNPGAHRGLPPRHTDDDGRDDEGRRHRRVVGHGARYPGGLRGPYPQA